MLGTRKSRAFLIVLDFHNGELQCGTDLSNIVKGKEKREKWKVSYLGDNCG